MKSGSKKGFTLIEMVIVILITGILAAVAIPQFIDYRKEAKNAKIKYILGAVRAGIANQYANQLLRCFTVAGQWPKADSVEANDITAGAAPYCAVAFNADYDVNSMTAEEKKFILGGSDPDALPNNPWGVDTPLTSNEGVNTVTKCVDASGGGGSDGCARCEADGCDGNSQMDGGWCYNESTGDFWADSASNGGVAGEKECNF